MSVAALRPQLSRLFSEMSIATFICLAIGLILIVVEFYQSCHRVLGLCGALITVLGVVLRMLAGGTPVMLFFMTFIWAILLLFFHLLMLRRHKRAWLLQSLSMAITDSDDGMSHESYYFLVGLEGVATTDINPKGHIAINDVNFFVASAGETIEKDSRVAVKQVQGDRILVEKISNA